MAVAEGACQGEGHHTCRGEHQEEEAYQVVEDPACQGACRVEAGHPCQEEGRASSEEDPWASGHTCPAEDQAEAASVDRPAALARSLAEDLAPEVPASSGREDACLEEEHPGALALGEARIALAGVVRAVSLPESVQEAYTSQAQRILAAAAASCQEQDHQLLLQVQPVPVVLG